VPGQAQCMVQIKNGQASQVKIKKRAEPDKE
jgi:hypothetical protein